MLGYTKDTELGGTASATTAGSQPQKAFSNLKRFVGRAWDELDDGSLTVPYTVRANSQGTFESLARRPNGSMPRKN